MRTAASPVTLFVLLALAVLLASAGVGGQQSGKVQAARVMYRPQELVGTLVSVEQMYRAEGVTWYTARLRLDEEATGFAVGDVLSVRYGVGADERGRTPGVGDQVRPALLAAPHEEDLWLSQASPVVLGRGELLRPGEHPTAECGSPDARVLVKVLAPLAPDCHQRTVELLARLCREEPERVRVQLFDMVEERGREELRRERLQCATVLVNNRLRFDLDGRKVAFTHRPNEERSSYRSEDVVAVVRQEIGRLYPPS